MSSQFCSVTKGLRAEKELQHLSLEYTSTDTAKHFLSNLCIVYLKKKKQGSVCPFMQTSHVFEAFSAISPIKLSVSLSKLVNSG